VNESQTEPVDPGASPAWSDDAERRVFGRPPAGIAAALAVICGLGAIAAVVLGEWTLAGFLLVVAAALLALQGLGLDAVRARSRSEADTARPYFARRWWAAGRGRIVRQVSLRRLRAERERELLALAEAAYREDNEAVERGRARLRSIDHQIRREWHEQLATDPTERLSAPEGSAGVEEPPSGR
jgi:hypothetical protein